jgi:hypothetical protein
VRRDGRWTLPHRLALRTAWCDVMLDLTSAVRSGPELVIEFQVRGGNVELVLAPGMVADANELSVRHSRLAISRDAGDSTPETLHVHLTGRMRHAGSTPDGWRHAGDSLVVRSARVQAAAAQRMVDAVSLEECLDGLVLAGERGRAPL